MKRSLIIVIWMFLPIMAFNQVIDWEKHWGVDDIDVIRRITKIKKHYYSLAFAGQFGPGGTFGLIKTDSIGDTIWSKSLKSVTIGATTYNLSNSILTDIKEGINSSIIICLGKQWGGHEAGLMKLDTNGTVEWLKFLGFGSPGLTKTPARLHVLPNGDIITVGVHEVVSLQNDVFAARVDKDGNVKWRRQYFKGRPQHIWTMIAFSDGSFYLGGYTGTVSANKDSLYLMKIEPENGNVIFEKGSKVPVDTTSRDYHWIWDINEDINHDLITSAFTMTSSFASQRGYFMRYDSTFNLLFYKRELKGIPFFGYQLEDSNYVLGYAYNSDSSFIQKSNATGDSLSFLSLSGYTYDFTSDGSNGIMGCGFKELGGTLRQQFYLTHLADIGKPARIPCRNKPIIDTMYATHGPGFFQFEDSVRGGLEYNPELYHQWYFQDGQRADSADPLINFDNVAYPDSFWAVLIVFDGAGCSDTMSINAYTNEEIDFPLDDPVISRIKEEEESKIGVAAYPNPFTHDITFDIRTLQPEQGYLTIVSVTGQQVYERSFTSNAPFIVQEEFDNGLYFARIRIGEQLKVVKVIKQ